MARKFSPKDPDEVLDYSIDWSRLLGSDTISTVLIKVATNRFGEEASIVMTAGVIHYDLQLEQVTNNNTIVTMRFGSGTANVLYKITCVITTAGGLTFARTIELPIKEK